MSQPRPQWSIGLLLAACVVAVLYLLFIVLDTEGESQRREEPSASGATHSVPMPVAEGRAPASIRTQASGNPGLLVRVQAVDGRAIQGATLWLCPELPRAGNPLVDQRLGTTGDDGMLVVSADDIARLPDGYLVAAKMLHLPTTRRVSELSLGDTITLILEPANRLTVRCTDIHGAAVPGITVLLSPLAIPSELAREVGTEEWLDGFDSASAVYARTTDPGGIASFECLASKRFQIQVVSEYYEVADRSLFSVEVPGPELELKLTHLLAIVISAEDDEVLSYSMATGAECLAASPNALNTRRMQARLSERYPGAAVILGASVTAAMPCDQYSVDVLLAKGDPVQIEARFMPLVPDFAPLVIPKNRRADEQQVAEVTFAVTSALDEPSSFFDFTCVRRSPHGRFEVRIPPTGKLRLPYGEWELTSRNSFIRGQFEPKRFQITNPSETVSVRMLRQLVPCMLIAQGYRDERIRQGAVQLSAGGIHHAMMGPNLDQLTLWLPPGVAQFQFSAMGYHPTTFEATVFPMTSEKVQTIPLKLVHR